MTWHGEHWVSLTHRHVKIKCLTCLLKLNIYFFGHFSDILTALVMVLWSSFNWNLSWQHIRVYLQLPGVQNKLLIVLTLQWHWQRVSYLLLDYFSQHLGEYLNVLSALESLNVAILKAMDKTKEVSLVICEFAWIQASITQKLMLSQDK